MKAWAPCVTIGIPVYNGANFLATALDTVLAQTFDDFEVVVCDNASTDATPDICEAYAAKDERVRCYRSSVNIGAAKNYNRVFSFAEGGYFKWLAADDYIEPEFLEQAVKMLDQDPEVVLVFSNYLLRNDMNNTISPGIQSLDLDLRLPTPQARVAKLVRRWALGPNWPIWGLIRTDVLRQTHLIRGFVGADDCLVLELALKGQFAQLSKYLHIIRSHEQAYHVRRYYAHLRIESTSAEIWFDPANRADALTLPHWRRLKEFYLIIVRSCVAWGHKWATLAILPRYAFQQYKKLMAEPIVVLARLAKHLAHRIRIYAATKST